MAVITRGEREIGTRFGEFPSHLRDKLKTRIDALTVQLQARIIAATPEKTGLLKSEITAKVYADSDSGRVAGYVSVYARTVGNKNEYAKAATLEYGSNKPRKIREPNSRILGIFDKKKRLVLRVTRAPHIEARRYLRDPFAQMRPEIEAALDEVIAVQVAEDES